MFCYGFQYEFTSFIKAFIGVNELHVDFDYSKLFWVLTDFQTMFCVGVLKACYRIFHLGLFNTYA